MCPCGAKEKELVISVLAKSLVGNVHLRAVEFNELLVGTICDVNAFKNNGRLSTTAVLTRVVAEDFAYLSRNVCLQIIWRHCSVLIGETIGHRVVNKTRVETIDPRLIREDACPTVGIFN